VVSGEDTLSKDVDDDMVGDDGDAEDDENMFDDFWIVLNEDKVDDQPFVHTFAVCN